MSKYTLVGGDGYKLLDLLARLKSRTEQRIAAPVQFVRVATALAPGSNKMSKYTLVGGDFAQPARCHRRGTGISLEEVGVLALKGLTQPIVAFNVPVASSANVVAIRPERAQGRIPGDRAR